MSSLNALHGHVPVAVLCDGNYVALPRASRAQFIAEDFYWWWQSAALVTPRPSIARAPIPLCVRKAVILAASTWVLPNVFAPSCVYCGQVPERLTIDHIVPVSFGGTNHITNLQVACGGCNTRHYRETFARSVYIAEALRVGPGQWELSGLVSRG
jgi:5-methylcytosine-specific restriction endonuclease McrA